MGELRRLIEITEVTTNGTAGAVYDVFLASTISVQASVDVTSAVANAGIKLQQSNDPLASTDPDNAIWSDLVSAVVITADAVVDLEKANPSCRYFRILPFLDSGAMTITNYILVKGEQP